MAYPVTLNGRTYTLADFEGVNYVEGLPDAFEDFVTHAGDLYNDTSTTSNSIGTGSKTFTVSSGKPYQAGTPLRIADAAAPATNFLDAVVTSYSGTTLVVEAIGYGGSGTKTSWTINIGGAKTIDGTLGVSQGGTGATTAAAARTNLDTYSKSEADSRFLNVSGEASDVSITGDLTVDTDTFVVDGTNDRVGIGASAPEQLLEVRGNDEVARFRGSDNEFLDIQANDGGRVDLDANNATGFSLSINTNPVLVIDTSQRVLIGTDSSITGAGSVVANSQVAGTNSAGSRSAFVFSTTNTAGSVYEMGKSGNATIGSHTIVADDETLGTLRFSGSDGTNFIRGAEVRAEVDGAPGTSDMPSRLEFSTTADGASSPTERMRITNGGFVGIGGARDADTPLHIYSTSTGSIIPSIKLQSNVSSNDSSEGASIDFVASGDNSAIGSRIIGTRSASGGNMDLRFHTGRDAFAMRIDNSKRVLIGTDSALTTAGSEPRFQVTGSSFPESSMLLGRGAANANASGLNFVKSRNVNFGGNTILQDDDQAMYIAAYGDDGTDYNTPMATIVAEVDGTPGSNDMPGRIRFSTTADGASSVTERMRIDSAGQIFQYAGIVRAQNFAYASMSSGTASATLVSDMATIITGGFGMCKILMHGNENAATNSSARQYIVLKRTGGFEITEIGTGITYGNTNGHVALSINSSDALIATRTGTGGTGNCMVSFEVLYR